ncbi:hypothetical protein ACKFKF_02000 [Phormidesmis sp. 146-12]
MIYGNRTLLAWLTRTVCAIATPMLMIASLIQSAWATPQVVKSAGLKSDLNVPFSQPVQVEDPYRDRSRKVISLWSRDAVRVLLTNNLRQCGYGYAYSASLRCLSPDCQTIAGAGVVR